MVINLLPTHWRYAPESLPPHGGKNVQIGKAPLFDLLGLQAEVKAGTLNLADGSQCEVVTRRCQVKLEELGWKMGQQVTQLFLALRPEPKKQGGDFRNAQWCEDSEGDWHPCDSYEIRFDDYAGKRNANACLVYFKFSLAPTGVLKVSLISCHL